MIEYPTPAAIRLMLHRCGLSRAEAAAYVAAEDRTVGRWLNGSFRMPPEKWQILVDLCERQDRAAQEALALSREKLSEPGPISVEMARTQDEAERFGWPCVGAHIAVIRRMIEWAPKKLEFVPVYPD